MKLPVHAFKTWWDVHAWAGVLISIVANAMFFAGAFTLFHDELTVWQDPRAHGGEGRCAAPPLEPLVARAVAASGLEPSMIYVSMLDVPCAPVSVHMHGPVEGEDEATLLVHRGTGEVMAEHSVIANFLYYLHFFYEPYVIGVAGMYVAGLVGVFLLVVVLTGFLIHLKDIRRQMHQLRLGRSIRVAWSDLHKVLGVMGLPFQTMMIATGAMVCLALPIQAIWTEIVFDGDAARALEGLEQHAPPALTGRAAGRMSVDELVALAKREVPELTPSWVWFQAVGDEAVQATIGGRIAGALFGEGDVTVSAVDGRVLEVTRPSTEGTVTKVTRWIYGLHFAWYGGITVRLGYALLGLAGCFTILSGNWIWLARRDPLRRTRGHRALGRITIGGGLGVFVAVAAMFLANRLLPIDASWHWHGEVVAFFGAWALSIVLAFTARSETVAARGTLFAAAAMFAATPLVGALRTPLSLTHAIAVGAWDVAGIDLGLFVLAASMLGGTRLLSSTARWMAPANAPRGARA